ncbi:HdeD family acid-resistance protein [Legionella spiritensis]|uniref:Acid-resistance membrane protein n=1 Tax=Legionella spiritensis TaxID=452 RepID=A0A0W0Z5H8_LEGSP|nr:DUF308 domain-containing protein [Legionella spiritensis]KTD64095.1 acid-resistance membrane protein [Legionella spiritensis]SNV37776.1 HdeD protein [Legionella spiritensis]VEG90129.1 HdeD protein [Legionella spiritensis]
MSNLDSMSATTRERLKRSWGWLLGLGILFLILGFIGLGMVTAVTLASVLFIGALLVIGGVIQLVDSFKCKHWNALIWHLLIALLYIFAGGLIIYDPILASTVITAILAWTLIVIGISRFFMAFALKQSSGWFWVLLAGIAAIVLGIMILMQWPMSGFWVIGLLVVIEMIITGWTYVFLAIAIRNV